MSEVLVVSESGSRIIYKYKNGKFYLNSILKNEIPFPLGLILNTYGLDLEPLDAIILTEEKITQGSFAEFNVIGCIRIFLNKSLYDDKILLTLKEDNNFKKISDIKHLSKSQVENIEKIIFSIYPNASNIKYFNNEEAKKILKKSYELYLRKHSKE
ncbi:MAG: inorganic diphosphatase [Candidatus Aenigmatarchaeota archaeon]|nr:inorganic diphosphatase [Candidatus Aenigmarchaeota archaeon]